MTTTAPSNQTDASQTSAKVLTKADFTSDQTIRWCPGCGDYSILANVQRVMPTLGVPKENIVFISGIGCSSRFPYYMNTYGFHTIHGRAPAVATGLKLTRPELSVWVVTGDGDGLSIGGNHLMHLLRRNLDIKVMMFNNRIYGLTKGQFSPTSEKGKITKSSVSGTLENPINPVRLALAAEATFVARTMDIDGKGLQEILVAANKHKGTAFVEIYQNCNIFNDGAFDHLSQKQTRQENTILLVHGQPLVFGAQSNKGLRLNGLTIEVVTWEGSEQPKDLLVHDAHSPNSSLAYLLASMEHPGLPVPMGIFRSVEQSTYEAGLTQQLQAATEKRGLGDFKKLLYSGDTWTVQ